MTRRHVSAARMKVSVALSLAIVAAIVAHPRKSLSAHNAEPTYAEDVAPILYKNCASCHRPGGMAPFSVLDYDSTLTHLDEMRVAVAEGQMPPWHAEGPHGMFRNDRRLSDSEKQTILRWIDAGAKSGDLKNLPPRPQFPDQWTIGSPDAVVSMSEEYTVPASGTIDYQYFQIPTNFTEDKWVQAIEIRPGAREIVHHVLVYAYAPPMPAPAVAPTPVLVRNKQHATPPPPPRADSLHAAPRQLGSLIGTYVPGTSVIEFPKGTALRLRAGTLITFQMHYTAHGHVMNDRTTLALRFAKEKPAEEIFANYFANGSFTLPAGAKDISVSAEIGVSRPVRIWGMMPHTHLRGTRWLYKLEKPDGSAQVVLDVPHYDFNWQTYYMFTTPIEVPAGGKITSMAWYDNSASNKHNPDASTDVHWGEQTWEEMQYTGFLYSVAPAPAKSGGP
jgi:hypothetical protein